MAGEEDDDDDYAEKDGVDEAGKGVHNDCKRGIGLFLINTINVDDDGDDSSYGTMMRGK